MKWRTAATLPEGRWIEETYDHFIDSGNSATKVALAFGFFIWHLDGISWADAPVPQRFHRCSSQTKAFINMEHVERCACGAIRQPRWGKHGWIQRNSRSRDKLSS